MFSLLLLKKKNPPVPVPLDRVYSQIESLLLKEGGVSYKNSQIDPFEETVANSFRSIIKDNGEYEIILTANPEKYSGKQIINHGSNNFTIIMRIYGPDLKYYEDKNSIPVGRIKKVSPHG